MERLDITPRLNDAETTWLCGFRRTQRAFHPDDPSAVPMHPSAEYLTHPLATKDPEILELAQHRRERTPAI